MTFECFKDWVFDVLNHAEDDVIADIALDDRQNLFRIRTVDGNRFEIECRRARRIREVIRRGKSKSEGNGRIAGRKASGGKKVLKRGIFRNQNQNKGKGIGRMNRG